MTEEDAGGGGGGGNLQNAIGLGRSFIKIVVTDGAAALATEKNEHTAEQAKRVKYS